MSRRHAIALTPAEQRQYLDEGHTIVLSTIDPRGYPHSVAMWYVADPDGTVLMTTFGKSQKAANLRRDPRCSLMLESGRTYATLKGILIRGRATLVADAEQVLDLLERVQAKYNPGQSAAGLREAMRGQAQKRVLVRIKPERVSSWDHAKLGGAY
jgi:PPOX class probable F420-dependent enzyme